jgi:7,8-dihydropterin-6-yl-methyl-4-(beta-D-ribofuranosyl)aminobenzene 5'-phosphate synthase
MRRVPLNSALPRATVRGSEIGLTVNLKAASKLEIISLIDNTVDYLSSAPRKEVQPLWHWTTRRSGEMPMAEHGFSMLIKIRSADSKSYTVLFDTGVSAEGVAENARRMGLDLGEVQTVVLSHGHFDHFGGLTEAVNAINRENLQIIVHEDMFKQRGTKNSRGKIASALLSQKFPSQKK